MDKVVVIGGSGFIGSHTADILTNLGYEVTIFDSKESPWLKSKQKMLIGDILDSDLIFKVLKDAKYVYHFAGIADIEESSLRPYDTINLNIMGTTNVLQAISKSKVNRFIYASTIYVYSPYGSFYRASKQAAETIIEAYNNQYGIDYTFLRYGSLYGTRSQEWNSMRNYIKQIINNGTIEYTGTGQERREYIHVEDAAKLSVDTLDVKYKNKAVTITGQQILYSQELIDLIFEIIGKKKKIKFKKPKLSNDHYLSSPYRFTPKSATKLVPRDFIDLGQGILELIEEISKESK